MVSTRSIAGAEAGFVPGSIAAGRRKVEQRVEKAAYRSHGHAAASIRKDASGSIKQRKKKRKAAPAGSPPFQHQAGFFRRALRYWVDRHREDAVIGFLRSRVGPVAAAHEHGEMEGGRNYPERPVMRPALNRNRDRFAKNWRASI